MAQQIIKYLYNNTLELRNKKLKNDYNKIHELYNEIASFVDNYSIKYPYMVNVITGGSNNVQYGSGQIDQDLLNKMSAIAEIFKKYKDLDIGAIEKKADQLNIDLDNLIKEIRDINTTELDSLETVGQQDKIMNNLETIRTNASKFASGMKISTQKLKIYLPITEDFFKGIPNQSYIKTILDDLSVEIAEIKSTATQQGMVTSEQVKTISDKINGFKTNLEKGLNQMKIILAKIQSFNDDFKNKHKFEYNPTEISIIMSLEELTTKINSIYATARRPGTNSDVKEFVETPFFLNFNTAYKKYEEKKMKEKDIVQLYNDLIGTTEYNKVNLPGSLFNGKYTTRLTNNLLMNDKDIEIKLESMKTLINMNSALKKPKDTYIDIYKPDFEKMKPPMIGQQVAGNGNQSTISYLATMVADFNAFANLYNQTYEDYVREVKYYNKLETQLYADSLYFTLIVTNQLFMTDYVIYDYMNKGTITFYHRIVNNILEKINNGVESDEILYLRKYHMITLVKLLSFLNELSQNIKPDQIIDIKNCSGATANRFLLLNYFKTILESYKEMYQNAITIYARINDINTPINISNKKQFTDQKMFLSDFERKQYLQLSVNDANFKTTKQPTVDIRKPDVDSGLMFVRASTCPSLLATVGKQNKFKNLDYVNAYKFTEVFDSTQFPMNGDISKYMTLDTQLSKGKGVAIMTYGYSGTGKTYTLFGSSSDNKEGILQATLDNINGLKSVNFRLFEIYGYGLTYPHYWTDQTTGKSRMDNIEHKIYKYKIRVETDKLGYESNEIVKSFDIRNYITDKKTYTEIPGSMVSNIFRNFDTFMKEIEFVREGKDRNGVLSQDENILRNRRIRDTPNNIVSSRSIIVCEFILKIGENDVPFLIVDLPGREEISQTYIEPFLGNNTIQNILANGLGRPNIDDDLIYIRALLAIMALNPIAVSVFEPLILFDTINNNPQYVNDILKKKMNMEFDYDPTYNTTAKNLSSLDLNTYTVDTTKNKIKSVSSGINITEEMMNLHGAPLSHFFSLTGNKLRLDNATGGFGYTSDNKYQPIALIGIHIMNRLLLLNRFDIIYEIYKKIIDATLNNMLKNGVNKIPGNQLIGTFDKLRKSNFKGELISKLMDDVNFATRKEDDLRALLTKVIQYDYYLTPLEGLYINENIIGLIKFMGERMITDEGDRQTYLDKFLREKSQPTNLNFQHQQKIARTWLMSEGLKLKEDIMSFFMYDKLESVPKPLFSQELRLIQKNVQLAYDTVTKYKSDGIFNFKKPLITDILEPYINKIRDYKVFYLFGNYGDTAQPDKNNNLKALGELKCYHQYNLLDSTEDFIANIVKN